MLRALVTERHDYEGIWAVFDPDVLDGLDSAKIKSTENVLQKFETIDKHIKTVPDQEENIRNAMEEQGQ